jgi:hypothetical protein
MQYINLISQTQLKLAYYKIALFVLLIKPSLKFIANNKNNHLNQNLLCDSLELLCLCCRLPVHGTRPMTRQPELANQATISPC